jgi:hypothetical protein
MENMRVQASMLCQCTRDPAIVDLLTRLCAAPDTSSRSLHGKLLRL